MKILVNAVANGRDYNMLNYQILSTSPATDVRYMVIDAEYLPYREGFYQNLEWDSDKEVFKFVYVEKPKSREEIMLERIAAQQKAITELAIQIAKGGGQSSPQEDIPAPPSDDEVIDIKPARSGAKVPDSTSTPSETNNTGKTLDMSALAALGESLPELPDELPDTNKS